MIKGQDYTGISIVFLCTDGKGNLLMQKRSENCRDEHNRWDCGSGGLDVHDTVEGTLKKELMEEYCVTPISYEFLGYRDVHRINNGEKTHWVALDYKVLVERGKEKNGEPHKFEEIAWFPLDNLPENIHSQLSNAVEKYRGKLFSKVSS